MCCDSRHSRGKITFGWRRKPLTSTVLDIYRHGQLYRATGRLGWRGRQQQRWYTYIINVCPACWQPRYPRNLVRFSRFLYQLTRSSPLDRWLCAPAFQRVCHKTVSNMHNHPPQGKGLLLVYL